MTDEELNELSLNELAEYYRNQKARALATGTCASCKERIDGFKDELSKIEFGISGLCQKCQDEVFTPPEDEEEEPHGEGPPPYDAATRTGMYDPEGH